MTAAQAERWLVLLMRLTGIAMLLALVGVAMPAKWMAATHEWLGMGIFPEAPIVVYLARSLAAFYAFMGGLFLIFAREPQRYGLLIRYTAWVAALGGVGVTALDFHLGLPLLWSLGEGPPTILLGLALLFLERKARG